MSVKIPIFEQLIFSIEKIHPLSLKMKEMLRSSIGEEFHKKGTLLLHSREPQLKYWLVVEGSVREFSGRPYSADQHTEWFWYQHDFIYTMPGFFSQRPTENYLEILEYTHLIYINYEDYSTLKSKFPEAELLFERIRDHHKKLVFNHLNQLRHLTARERYEILFSERPQLFNLCKQKDIACFLGIEPDTLSRIRKSKG